MKENSAGSVELAGCSRSPVNLGTLIHYPGGFQNLFPAFLREVPATPKSGSRSVFTVFGAALVSGVWQARLIKLNAIITTVRQSRSRRSRQDRRCHPKRNGPESDAPLSGP